MHIQETFEINVKHSKVKIDGISDVSK